MALYCPQVYILLAAVMEVHGQTCPAGWFGTGCRFLCHCANSHKCSSIGVCPGNGKCKSPYFGPGCQYADWVLLESSPSTPTYLRDGLDTTCNPNARATSATLFLRKYVPFTWYRMHVKNKNSLSNFTTTVNNGKRCRSQTIYPVHATAVDVWCYLDINVISITIEGAVAASICTVRISGDRNVALRQKAQQSTDYLLDPKANVVAENAVDGNTGQMNATATCTQTQFENAVPYWRLTLDRSYWLRRVVVYNRIDHRDWLEGFTIETFNERGNRTNWFKDTLYQLLLIYEINLVQWEPVKTIHIATENRGSLTKNVLSLCEVEAMGESACSMSTYGFSCEKACPCSKNVQCSVVTGACPISPLRTCPQGKFGKGCLSLCSEHCHFNVCETQSGRCLQCTPGYTGDFCDKECPAGRFGPACNLRCSVNCLESCQHITGHCVCRAKFTGHLCSECVPGFYGEACTERCPHLCETRMCDQRTGKCLSCIGKRTGVNCESCVHGYYGALCDKKCSTLCSNNSCDSVSGACWSCMHGFKGEYCDKEEESNLLSLWMIPMIVPIIAVTLCCWVAGGKPKPRLEQ